ncbi:MAG: hypothetical protein U5L02_10290 [Rheinheimera sp.]|nr:hypothetical protein [Rheinheimera sp.]
MTNLAKEIVPINIEEELKNSYLDYAMSVIVGRALPDVRDGLKICCPKPVHRRVLFAMENSNLDRQSYGEIRWKFFILLRWEQPRYIKISELALRQLLILGDHEPAAP